MIRYIIACSLLGLKNAELLDLLRNHKDKISSIFDDTIQIQTNEFGNMRYNALLGGADERERALDSAEELLIQNDEFGIKSTCYGEENYPEQLMQTDNPPAIIYYRGAEFYDLSKKTIACLGTEKPKVTAYNAVNYLMPQWARGGCTIISGLEKGVDQIALQSAMTAGGKVIAVAACGLDRIEKPLDRFAERILESGGIIVSENAMGVNRDRYSVNGRNRLAVGLSKVVTIMECEADDDLIQSALIAGRQGKSVFCPAGGSSGTERLISEGAAIAIKGGKDTAQIRNILVYDETRQPSAGEIKVMYMITLVRLLKNVKALKDTCAELGIPYPDGRDAKLIAEQLDSECRKKGLTQNDLTQTLVRHVIE